MPPHAESDSAPDADTLLRCIAAAAPGLWFPQRHAELSGIPRAALDEPLWLLRKTGLVEVGDWVKGLGQGMRLSADGERAMGRDVPAPVESRQPIIVQPTAIPSPLDPPPAVIAPALLYANLAWFAVGCVVAWRAGVGLEFLKGDGHPGVVDTLMRTGAMSASSLLGGEWWRLVTCCFVHVGLFHLIGNLLMLGLVGPFAEGLVGRWRFAVVYSVSGVVGSMAAAALHPVSGERQGVEVVLAGASGALWGMLGGLVVWVLRYRSQLPRELSAVWLRKLVFVIMVNLAISFAPGVSAEAHFGGGLAGAAVMYLIAGRRSRLGSLPGILLVLLVAAGGLFAAIRWTDDWKTVRGHVQLREMVGEAVRIAAEQEAERAAIRDALGDDWAKLSPREVEHLQNWFANPPSARHRDLFVSRQSARHLKHRPGLRKAANDMLTAATNALGKLNVNSDLIERYRAYFTAVAAFAAAVRDDIDRPAVADVSEINAKWQAVALAVRKIGMWE